MMDITGQEEILVLQGRKGEEEEQTEALPQAPQVIVVVGAGAELQTLLAVSTAVPAEVGAEDMVEAEVQEEERVEMADFLVEPGVLEEQLEQEGVVGVEAPDYPEEPGVLLDQTELAARRERLEEPSVLPIFQRGREEPVEAR